VKTVLSLRIQKQHFAEKYEKYEHGAQFSFNILKVKNSFLSSKETQLISVTSSIG
jgi:hypothetical protein